ncbi:hypothetical protein [Actinomycetospora atypica]|uniref:Glycosyltransferase RgtA/B/C/D-like domain-containing protein n=1 Tax=Actinomycetospora atypica TaxID=1290095 RepID=A0ABV9YJC7_9PSEU
MSAALAVAALVCLPLAASSTDVTAMGGLGLAGVLSGWGWGAVLLAVLACAAEFAGRARPRVLGFATGTLILCSTGMPSVVETGARIPTAWLHSGFVEVIARTGRVPADVDARFSWAGFFAQWAWITEAGGGASLDVVLRWTPPVIVVVWAVGVFAIARPLLGAGRGPWVAVWLFCGANWIEQDYFSPQATAIVFVLAVLALVVGPLATRRVRPEDEGWPLPDPGASPSGPVRRMLVAALTPVRRPDVPGSQVLLSWLACGLCLLAVVVDHQLTPFALGGQLLVLALAGRFWGRWLVLVLIAAELTWVVIGAREVWLAQLQLITGDLGDVQGALSSSLLGRLVGDPGQLVVKAARIVTALATWLLALMGAWIRWRRDREVVLLLVALVPVVLVAAQSYGGEVLLRVMLYGLPVLAVLGAEAIRTVGTRWRRRPAAGLSVVAMIATFLLLVVLRGGNDSYLQVTPRDVAITRAVIAETPPGAKLLPLSRGAPLSVARVGELTQVNSARGCSELADDLRRCVDLERPDRILVMPNMDAGGVALENRPPGWTRDAVRFLTASGAYRLAWQIDGPGGPGDVSALLVRVVP